MVIRVYKIDDQIILIFLINPRLDKIFSGPSEVNMKAPLDTSSYNLWNLYFS